MPMVNPHPFCCHFSPSSSLGPPRRAASTRTSACSLQTHDTLSVLCRHLLILYHDAPPLPAACGAHHNIKEKKSPICSAVRSRGAAIWHPPFLAPLPPPPLFGRPPTWGAAWAVGGGLLSGRSPLPSWLSTPADQKHLGRLARASCHPAAPTSADAAVAAFRPASCLCSVWKNAVSTARRG